MITACKALDKILRMDDIQTVLDVGSGAGLHAKAMRDNGKIVITNSLIPPADIVGDFMDIKPEEMPRFDCIWAAHVLEHQPNPGTFLKKCFEMLTDNGVLAVTVPPLKHEIVGGHVNLYNAGILLYQAILAGFDCSKAMVKTYGYNISLIVRKQAFELPALTYDSGDIELLAPFFPMPVKQGFNGDIKGINW